MMVHFWLEGGFRCRVCLLQASAVSICAYFLWEETLGIFVMIQFQTTSVLLGHLALNSTKIMTPGYIVSSRCEITDVLLKFLSTSLCDAIVTYYLTVNSFHLLWS